MLTERESVSNILSFAPRYMFTAIMKWSMLVYLIIGYYVKL